MILIRHFRPVRPLDESHPGRSQPARHICLAIVCYKGDAPETQSSEQIGAQTQGTATKGDKNNSNTGTQVLAAPLATGDNNKIQSGGQNIGNNSTVTTTDDGAVTAAVSALQQALLSSNNALAVNSASANATAAQVAAALAANPGSTVDTTDSSGGLGQVATSTAAGTDPNAAPAPATTSWWQNLNAWQIAGVAIAALGLLYTIFKKKKST